MVRPHVVHGTAKIVDNEETCSLQLSDSVYGWQVPLSENNCKSLVWNEQECVNRTKSVAFSTAF